MSPRVAASVVTFAVALLLPALALARAPFSHPGIFVSQAEIDVIRTRASDPRDPMHAAYESTMATKFADVNFKPQPMPRVGRKGLGPKDPPVIQRDSAMVAHTLALRWLVKGDVAARDKALAIMDAWADVFDTNEGDENRFLDSSWVITVWASAGEMMLHGKVHGRVALWPAPRVAKFKEMICRLNDESKQIVVRPFNPVSNWGTSAMLGDMAAGVFLDDRVMYDRGRDALLKYMPQIINKAGYCNEVFRDPWHGIVALTGTIQAAEVGRHQNDPAIYQAKYDGQTEPRILVALKWYADPLRGKPVKLPPMGGPKWKTEPWEFVANNSSRNTGGFEMALNYYTHVAPLRGLDEFRDAVLTTYRPSGQDNSIFIGSDSLTHAELSKRKTP